MAEADMPTWPCGSGQDKVIFAAYEQGIVCQKCKKRFGVALVLSNGTPHQYIAQFTCIECYKKDINPQYPHAPAMLEWMNGKPSS